MKAIDLQLKEIEITKTVGMLLQSFDLIVCAFERASADRKIIEGKNAIAMPIYRFRKALEHRHLGLLCPVDLPP